MGKTLFLVNFLINSSFLLEPLWRLYIALGYTSPPFLTVKGQSILFPNVTTRTGLLLVNLLVSCVFCFGALPSLIVVLMNSKKTRLTAVSAFLFHTAITASFWYNFAVSKIAVGPIIRGVSAQDQFIAVHYFIAGVHSLMAFAFLVHLMRSPKKSKLKKE